ncbi:MAG: sigma-70 family RNA polymerase sigma factor [Chitinophagaceae bacterium]|nr:sigma-70 family RNA polymerase sigma factor [Chitinophagaceae bacterium]
MTPLNLDEEKKLLGLVAKGDRDAYGQLFTFYYPLLFPYINKITGSVPETESILQDVFLKIWLDRESLVTIERFKPWLLVMARNRARNALRSLARRELAEGWLAASAEDLFTPEDMHLKELRIKLINEAIELLPLKYREVWIMNRRDKEKQAVIAEKLGISLPTVKKYIQLSVQFIKDYVNERSVIFLLTCSLLVISVSH